MSDSVVDLRAEGPLRQLAGAVGLALLLLTSGCATLQPVAPVAPPPADAAKVEGETVAPSVAQPSPATAPPQTVAAPAAIRPVEPAARTPTPSAAGATPGETAGKAAPPAPKAPVKPAVPPAPAAQPAAKAAPPPDGARPKAPPLDLATLEQRLKEARAIGVLTKITLKNQVDDLLDQFRAYHQGKLKATLAELRRAYDALVLKVLALLQDGDQALATAVAASREAIWGILSDRAKFATI